MKKILLLLIVFFNLIPCIKRKHIQLISMVEIKAQSLGDSESGGGTGEMAGADGLTFDEWNAITDPSGNGIENFLNSLSPGSTVDPAFVNAITDPTLAAAISGSLQVSTITISGTSEGNGDYLGVKWIQDESDFWKGTWVSVYSSTNSSGVTQTTYTYLGNFDPPANWPVFTNPNDLQTWLENEGFATQSSSPDPDRQPVDIRKMMKCFSLIPDAGATFSVQMGVDIPNPSDPSQVLVISWPFSPGHTFITMTKTGANGQSITQSFGFYPLIGPHSLSGITSGDFNPVPSVIINNGNAPVQHSYEAMISNNGITAAQFQTLINTAISASSHNYDLNDYNCTNYALDIFNSIRITPLSSTYTTSNGVTFNQCPTGLYNQLQWLQNSGTHSDITIPVTNGKASTSHGECPL